MRALILVLIGLALGAALTLIGMNALRQGTAYPNGLMAVMAAQMKAIDVAVKENRCADSDLQPGLQTLRYLGNHLEPAFLPTQDDERFIHHSANMRAAVDAALATPATNCTAAKLALDEIGASCKDCHRDFKN